MTSLAATNSAARILLLVTVAGFVLSEVSIRLRSATRRGAVRQDRGSVFAVIGAVAAGALAAAWCATTGAGAVHGGSAVLFACGVALMWIGIGLRQWAVATLGPFFTVVVAVTDRQAMIDRGPYGWVRHPSYTGLLLSAVGLGMTWENWLSTLSLTVLPLLGIVIRIRVEERALRAALGEPYLAYAAAHRWRLVPGLW